jgi:hypothetical protein
MIRKTQHTGAQAGASPPAANEPEYFTVVQVAGRIQLNPRTLRAWIRKGHVGAEQGVIHLGPHARIMRIHWATFTEKFLHVGA